MNEELSSYPLSLAQRRIWDEYHDIENDCYCNVDIYFRMTGEMDVSLFKHVINDVCDLHPILRATLKGKNHVPLLKYLTVDQFYIKQIDLSNFDKGQSEIKLRNYIEKMRKIPIDMHKGLLIRLHLIKMNEKDHVFGIEFNHIITDAPSVLTLVHQIFDHYWEIKLGKPSTLIAPKKQYNDFVRWEQKQIESENLNESMKYWIDKLSYSRGKIILPHKEHPNLTGFAESVVDFKFDKILSNKIKESAIKNRVTLFCFLLSLYKICLFKISRKADISVAIPSIRKPVEFKETLGLFVNTTVIRTQLDEKKTFIETLKKVNHSLLEALRHQIAPFEKVRYQLKESGLLKSDSLFNMSFSLLSVVDMNFQVGDWHVDCIDTDSGYPEFGVYQEPSAIKIDIYEGKDNVIGKLKYNRNYYSRENVQKIIHEFNDICKFYVLNENVKLGIYTINFKNRNFTKELP